MSTEFVKIKTWAQMEKEYGLDKGGPIRCKYMFTDEMETLLPTDRIIEISSEGTWKTTGYAISSDMIDFELGNAKPSYKTLVKGV